MLRLYYLKLILLIISQSLFFMNPAFADEKQMNLINTKIDPKITTTNSIANDNKLEMDEMNLLIDNLDNQINELSEHSNINNKLLSDKLDNKMQEATAKIEEISINNSRLLRNLDGLTKNQSKIEINMGNKIKLLNEKLQLLNENYGSLMADVTNLTNDTTNEIKSLNERLLLLNKNYGYLTTDLNKLSNSTNNEIISIKRSVFNKFLTTGISIIIIIIISIISFVFIQRKFKKINVLEESVNLDVKLSEILEKQLILMKNDSIKKESHGSDITNDHLLAINVGSEIFRMYKRIEIMDVSTKGLTALKNALTRMEDEFIKQGYTIKDLAGQPYQDEMTVRVVNSIKRGDLKPGDKLITRMITPQVYYNGVVISHGEVEIAVSSSE